MSKLKSLVGQTFGRLTVIERAENDKRGSARWICRCSCPDKTICVVDRGHLISGNTKSCGCLRKEKTSKTQKTHGMSRTRIYGIWCDIKDRCYNTNNPAYYRYGGKKCNPRLMCEKWKDSFEAFYDDVSKLPHYGEEGYSLERIDNTKGYSPENCKWATAKEQANNTMQNRLELYNGERYTIAELADITGINRGTLNTRINRLGWNISKAIETPINEKYWHKKTPK